MLELLKEPIFLQYIQLLVGLTGIGYSIRVYVKQTKTDSTLENNKVILTESLNRLEKSLSKLEELQSFLDDDLRELRDKVLILEVEISQVKTELTYYKQINNNKNG